MNLFIDQRSTLLNRVTSTYVSWINDFWFHALFMYQMAHQVLSQHMMFFVAYAAGIFQRQRDLKTGES